MILPRRSLSDDLSNSTSLSESLTAGERSLTRIYESVSNKRRLIVDNNKQRSKLIIDYHVPKISQSKLTWKNSYHLYFLQLSLPNNDWSASMSTLYFKKMYSFPNHTAVNRISGFWQDSFSYGSSLRASIVKGYLFAPTRYGWSEVLSTLIQTITKLRLATKPLERWLLNKRYSASRRSR